MAGTTYKERDRTRSSGRKWAVRCVGGGALLVVGASLALVVLMHARWEAKSRELMPVVEALERHQSDHGHYPEMLADLRPDYLPEDPPTKLSYTFNLEPHIGEDGDSPAEPGLGKRDEHQGYQLGYCFVFNQCIVYRPGRDYPESIRGGFFLSEVLDSGWALYVT